MSDRIRPLPQRPTILAIWACLLLMPLALAACSSEKDRLEAIAATAAAGRSAAATSLRTAFFAKEITANAAIDLAHTKVDRLSPSTYSTQPTANDIAFAGAVLDFIEQTEPDIDAKVLNEFFWIRIGTLAGNAAAAARKAEDLPAARALVLAGPTRWQTEAYWRQHPAHDALASMILFESGESDKALNRLRDRPDLADDVQIVKDTIEKELKKRPRK
ncbi:MAG TPA: hypothetical protein PKE29_09145 [Phycisphaerales bacterium]|nr:hypothetical protein [Phycisphaerales bacterium]